MSDVRFRLVQRGLILLLLLMTNLAAYSTGPAATADPHAAGLNLRDDLERDLGAWQLVRVRDEDDAPEALEVDEFFQGLYRHEELGLVALTLEFTANNLRQREVHYPDICHAIRGDRLLPFPPVDLHLGASSPVEAAVLDWQHPNQRQKALAIYWYVTGEGATTNTFEMKWQQALAGILRQPKAAAMVRFDVFYDREILDRRGRQAAIESVQHFIGELAGQRVSGAVPDYFMSL